MGWLFQPAWKRGAQASLQQAFEIGGKPDRNAAEEALRHITSAPVYNEKKELRDFAELVDKKSRIGRALTENEAAKLQEAAVKAGIKLEVGKAKAPEKRKISLAGQKGIPVLLYHDISSNPTQYGIEMEDFVVQMQDLGERRLKTVTASELPALLKGKPPSNTIVLTFDDGHESVYTKALPLLKKYNLKATIFVDIKSVGARDYLSWKQLKEISGSGLVEIGSHSLTHRHMKTLDESEAFEELTESKRILEERLGIEVKSFAWPYGERNAALDKLAEKAGYTSVFGSFAEKSGINPFFLKRYNIMGSLGGQEFERIVRAVKPVVLGMVPKKLD